MAIRHFGTATALVLAIGVAGALLGLSSLPSNGSGAKAADTPSATSTPSPSTKAPNTCAKQFVQVPNANNNNRVDDNFAQEYAKATAAANNLSDGQKAALLTNSANNGQRLAIWARAFGILGDRNVHVTPADYAPLIAGKCLSEKGQQLWYEFKGLLTASKTTEADVPANYTNSGVDNGTFGVSATAGIGGDRKAIEITLPNGQVVWIMIRCGNVAYASPPGGSVPNVPTDQCQYNASLPPNSPECVPPPTTPTCEQQHTPCSKGGPNATVPGYGQGTLDGDSLDNSTPSTGTNVSGTIGTPSNQGGSNTGSNGQTGSYDHGSSVSAPGATTGSSGSSSSSSGSSGSGASSSYNYNPGANQSTNSGDTSTGNTGAGNTNQTPVSSGF